MKSNQALLIKSVKAIQVAMLVMLTGCDGSESLSLNKQSIIYCAEGAPESFNPQTVTSGTTIDATASQLYDRLITFDKEDNSIIPALAKSWHVTRDGKIITFYLRKEVDFHQTDYFTPTRKFNADDVLFTFNRILDQNHPYHLVSGGRYPFFQNVEFSNIVKSIEKINDHTIRFKLNQANSSFLSNLATDYAVILSSEYAEQLTLTNDKENIDNLPIGTGPFKFKQYQPGSHIRYYRNDKYWHNDVPIQQLVFDITTSNTGRLTKLLTKECDVISYPIAREKIEENPNLTLEAVTSFNIGYLGFNTIKPPFDNQLVREAISFAINKDAIIETVYFGEAEIAKSILPKNSWAYDKTIESHEYSISKAKELLAIAGYPNGFEMDIWAMPVQRAYNPNALKMAKLIQADLQQIDVKVNIVSYEWSTFLRRVSQGEHQTVLLGWSADNPDPDNFLTPLLSCASVNTGSNRAMWCNQEFDSLLQLSLKTTNITQRKAFYAQAQAIIAQELPLLPIAHSKRFQARSKNIEGKLLSSFGGINFAEVSKN